MIQMKKKTLNNINNINNLLRNRLKINKTLILFTSHIGGRGVPENIPHPLQRRPLYFFPGEDF